MEVFFLFRANTQKQVHIDIYSLGKVLYFYFVLQHILLLVLTMLWLLTIGRYFTISGQFTKINRRLRLGKHLLNFIDRARNKFHPKGLQEKSLRIYGICWFIWKRVWCKSDDRSFNSVKGEKWETPAAIKRERNTSDAIYYISGRRGRCRSG